MHKLGFQGVMIFFRNCRNFKGHYIEFIPIEIDTLLCKHIPANIRASFSFITTAYKLFLYSLFNKHELKRFTVKWLPTKFKGFIFANDDSVP